MSNLAELSTSDTYRRGRAQHLAPEVILKFEELADAQRGEPEIRMVEAQRIMGGGVLSFVIEHVGDLTNRMAQNIRYDTAGYGYVRDKVEKSLGTLLNSYGFEREHLENMQANASYHNHTFEDHMKATNEALTRYADAHAKLKVYNYTQWHAREAAVALGRQNFQEAIHHLQMLRGIWLFAEAAHKTEEQAFWDAATVEESGIWQKKYAYISVAYKESVV